MKIQIPALDKFHYANIFYRRRRPALKQGRAISLGQSGPLSDSYWRIIARLKLEPFPSNGLRMSIRLGAEVLRSLSKSVPKPERHVRGAAS